MVKGLKMCGNESHATSKDFLFVICLFGINTCSETEIDLTEYSMYKEHNPINEMSTEGLLRSKLEGGRSNVKAL